MNDSMLRRCVLVLGAALMVAAAAAEARPPWTRHGAEAARAAPRWHDSPALGRILAQSRERMSNAERERLRRDLSATPRDRRGNGAAPRDHRMTQEQRESLRRDMRDANRQLDRNGRRGGNGGRGGNGERNRGRR